MVERYYADKALVAAMLRPASIAEIGVRYGYSAAAFLSACSCTYVGYDADIAGSGGSPGALARAKVILERHFPGRTRLVHADTQKLAALDCGPVDLVHVDGDHSYEGCLHDLRLAPAVARWVLVDDVTNILDVARARDVFLATSGFHAIRL